MLIYRPRHTYNHTLEEILFKKIVFRNRWAGELEDDSEKEKEKL